MHTIKTNTRQASIKDIEHIYNIEKTSFGNHHWTIQCFKNELKSKHSKYFVYEDIKLKDEILGYAGYWKIIDEGHITTLAVHPNYRNKGIADKLLYTLINDAKKSNIKWLTLEVRVSNIPAINLYRKFHFSQLGIRKNYYQDNNEDALILWSQNLNDDCYSELIYYIS